MLKRTYASIAKSETQPDGTVKVWGYASSGAVDSDGETITPDAMKAALPDYMTFGAVREMHDAKKAAGTAIEASVEDDGRTYFGAHIVDAEAVKKVLAGVYKGFSIGGKVLERDTLNKTVIKSIKLVEVSLVDRPANPEAIITIMKAEATPEDDVTELAEMLDAKTITPAQVLALIKAAAALPAATTETVAKGMAHVADLAYLLKQVMFLVRDQQAEAAREADASAIPAALTDWLDAGGLILKDMVTEEVAELVAGLSATDTVPQYVYLADKALALAGAEVTKSGKALSAASMAQVKAIHDASAALGGCDTTGKAAHGDDLAKAQTDHDAALTAIAKAAGAGEGVALAEFIGDLAKAAAEVEPLRKRVADLEALPAPGKALLKTIGKGGDTADGATSEAPAVDPVRNSDGTVNELATLIKNVHARQ